MNLITVREIYKNRGQYLSQGIPAGEWVRSIRNSKAFGFIVVSDGPYFETLQTVYHGTMPNFDKVRKLNVGTAIIVKGTPAATPEVRQSFEIQATEVAAEGLSAPDYPLQKRHHSFEYLRTIPHLRLRTNTSQVVFRVRSSIVYTIHQYFQERNFAYAHTPLITASGCEGAGETFQAITLDLGNIPETEDGAVDFSQDSSNKPISLTVSGQPNGETRAMAFHNIYAFGPTLRAENSSITRHATEFQMIEPEMTSTDLDGNVALAEGMLKYVIHHALEHAPGEMNFFNQFVDKSLLERLSGMLSSEFGHVAYTEVIKILEEHNDAFEHKISRNYDLQMGREHYLTGEVYKKPLFVTDYPKETKASYMKLSDDNRTVTAMDCLVPGIGEIIGGSQCEGSYDKLLFCMEELGLESEDYEFHLGLRKYGSTRYSGSGLNFKRRVTYLTDMDSIRNVIPSSRTTNSCNL